MAKCYYRPSTNSSIVQAMPFTQEYALQKMKDGVAVTIFTGSNPADAIEKLKGIGADSRLLNVESKAKYLGRKLEKCVDDSTPVMQGFVAGTHYRSGELAFKTEYPQLYEQTIRLAEEQKRLEEDRKAKEIEQKRLAEEAEKIRLEEAEKALREKGFLGFFRKMFN